MHEVDRIISSIRADPEHCWHDACVSAWQAATATNQEHTAGAIGTRNDFDEGATTVGTTTTIFSAPTLTGQERNGDFVQDVTEMASRIDRRLRLSLTPQQYAMVQDLVLATRITTIALDADDECAEPTAA